MNFYKSLLLVYANLNPVSTEGLKSLARRAFRLREGYLMLEMIIALGCMAAFSLSVGFLQTYSTMIQKDASSYLYAVTAIHKTFETLQRGEQLFSDTRMNITVRYHPSDKKGLDIVTISAQWQDSRDKKKTVTIAGALLRIL